MPVRQGIPFVYAINFQCIVGEVHIGTHVGGRYIMDLLQIHEQGYLDGKFTRLKIVTKSYHLPPNPIPNLTQG